MYSGTTLKSRRDPLADVRSMPLSGVSVKGRPRL